MSVRASLDVVTIGYAAGWAYPTNTKGRLVVQAMLNHAIIGEAVADLHRGDLASVGMGDGNYGFHIDFYDAIDVGAVPFVVVKLEDGDLDVPRSTQSGYSEFFQTLYPKSGSWMIANNLRIVGMIGNATSKHRCGYSPIG